MNVREIAKSIADELRKEPDRWAQGWTAFDKSGKHLTCSTDPDAHSLCIAGHVRKRSDGHVHAMSVIDEIKNTVGISGPIGDWNDAPGRTVEEVIALCDRVAAGEQS